MFIDRANINAALSVYVVEGPKVQYEAQAAEQDQNRSVSAGAQHG